MESMSLLKEELQDYIKTIDPSVSVIIDNIGLFESQKDPGLSDHIVLTLVNIEEESTLKNSSPVKKPFFDKAIYQNPPVFLNLYILITCNYSGKDYKFALQRLSFVIQFLQSKTTFSNTSTVSGGSTDSVDENAVSLKFTLELYTLTFEQINHLWGSLGGRQVPFAMYKLRLIAITERAIVREVPLIEEIDTILSKISGKN